MDVCVRAFVVPWGVLRVFFCCWFCVVFFALFFVFFACAFLRVVFFPRRVLGDLSSQVSGICQVTYRQKSLVGSHVPIFLIVEKLLIFYEQRQILEENSEEDLMMIFIKLPLSVNFIREITSFRMTSTFGKVVIFAIFHYHLLLRTRRFNTPAKIGKVIKALISDCCMNKTHYSGKSQAGDGAFTKHLHLQSGKAICAGVAGVTRLHSRNQERLE